MPHFFGSLDGGLTAGEPVRNMLPHNNDTGRYGVIGITSFSLSYDARRPSPRRSFSLLAATVFFSSPLCIWSAEYGAR